MYRRILHRALAGAMLRAILAGALFLPAVTRASMFSGEALDKAASVIALVVIFIVPIVLIVLFWMVHVLPEKIAHQRNHPQQEAIKILCLLSLVFGGLLWPLAWLWAYSKPVLYKLAYGTDKHVEHGAEAAGDEGVPAASAREQLAQLRAQLDVLVARGAAPGELAAIRDQLVALEPRLPAPDEEAR